jgi:hypothetical protein
LPPRQVSLRVDQVAVALDVASLAPDDEHDEVVVARVRELRGVVDSTWTRLPGPSSRSSSSISKRAVPLWTKYSSSWVSW